MVSIIVPVFNAEKYIQEAIDSVLYQSFTDWELILIDDGSTDSSGKICDRAARKTSRIKVIHQINKGVSAARNRGIDHARGSYITFLDADDILPFASLSLMMDCAIKSKADIICGKIRDLKGEVTPSLIKKLIKDLTSPTYRFSSFNSEKGLKSMLYQKSIDNSAWGKLYRRDLWDELRFKEDIRYEDLDLLPIVFLRAKTIKLINKITYLYRQQPESYIHTFSLGRADVLTVTSKLSDHVFREIPSLRKAARARELNANFNIFGLIAANLNSLPEEDKKKAILLKEQCREKIKELRGEVLRNPSVRLKTKIGILISYLGGFSLLEFLSGHTYKS